MGAQVAAAAGGDGVTASIVWRTSLTSREYLFRATADPPSLALDRFHTEQRRALFFLYGCTWSMPCDGRGWACARAVPLL
jgi:hypothetical protein